MRFVLAVLAVFAPLVLAGCDDAPDAGAPGSGAPGAAVPSASAPAEEPAARPAPPPAPVCDAVSSPFADPDRASLAALKKRYGSGFGDHRASFVSGHKHAGLDLKTRYGEDVYAICAGVVADIHLGYPHRTVVVRHTLPDGAVRWSSYKHVEDVALAVGDAVDRATRIGRVFTREEQAGAGWKLNHLHFEVRTSIADQGAASWTSMSMLALTRYATDPAVFFAETMGPR